MAKVLLTYDISDKHNEVKKYMLDKGYKDHWNSSNDKKINLPNTTLYKSGISKEAALEDVETACGKYNVDLERAVAVEYDKGWGIRGEPHEN